MKLNNITKSYIAHFLTQLTFFGAITVPFFIDWLQVDYTKIFLLQAWFSLWIVLLEIPTGVVADKYGRKTSVVLGAALACISILIFGITKEYWVLYVAEFIGAFGFTLLSGADTALIYDSLVDMKKEKDAKIYLSHFQAAGTFSLLLAYPLGSLVTGINILPYPNSLILPFLLTAFFIFLGTLIFLTVKEPTRHKVDDNFVRTGLNGLKYLKNHKTLRAFAANSVFIAAMTFFMFWLYQPLAQNAGIDVTYYGFIGAGFNLTAMILLLNVKKLEKIVSIRKVLLLTALIPGIIYILLAFTNNIFIVLVGIFLITNSKILRKPILADFMNKHIESHNRATVLSSISLMERMTIFLLYPIVGLLVDFNLKYALIFLGVATLFFALITRLEESHVN